MNNIKTLILFCSILFISFQTDAQINRTLETKVADILAQLPTDDLNHNTRLMNEISELGEPGILKFTDMLVPAGTGDDTQARYAINSLAIHAGGESSDIKANLVETTLVKAIQRTENNEVKTFLLERLVFCASNKSVSFLKGFLKDDQLFEPALEALYSIGTLEASNAIFSHLIDADTPKKLAFIEALGRLKFDPAVDYLEQFAASQNQQIVKASLRALALIGYPSSYDILKSAAAKSGYRIDPTEAVLALITYGQTTSNNGRIAQSNLVGNTLLKHCKDNDQWHFRSAGVAILNQNKGPSFTKTLVKELKRGDDSYKGAIANLAKPDAATNRITWVNAFKKAKDDQKPFILYILQDIEDDLFFNKCIIEALNDHSETVQIAGIKAAAYQNKNLAIPALASKLKSNPNKVVSNEIELALKRLCTKEDAAALDKLATQVGTEAKIALVNLWASKEASTQFNTTIGFLKSNNASLDTAVYKALPSIATDSNLNDLISLLNQTEKAYGIAQIQKAISKIALTDDTTHATVLAAYEKSDQPEKYLPVLPALSSDQALKEVTKHLSSTNTSIQESAVKALANWETNASLPYLFQAISKSSNDNIRDLSFTSYLKKITQSSLPADQKLLQIKKVETIAQSTKEKKQMLNSVSGIKTFLALMFVSTYLDDSELGLTAAQSAIRIALPRPDSKQKMEGTLVREILQKSSAKLTGPESQYTKIDVKEFLDAMGDDPGYLPIFNGKNLDGWQGLVENPIARSKMSTRTLAKKQKEANKTMHEDWEVQNNAITFIGEGFKNICTIKQYADFEMLVDWKIGPKGDSGIYLRGTPQVQIWDTTRVEVGAQVGSGGLYNNQKYLSKPLKVADNPINEWNTFRIKMVGERVTVYLNGQLVVNNIPLENYWDRKQAIFAKEAIELQAHGENVQFKNVYVKEIPSGNDQLSEAEQKEGFQSLFNGRDLSQFIGNKTDYLVEDKKIVVRPKQGGHGNLFTAEEYDNFVFRFEFKLTPGANNGLGIHAPLEGDVAYEGKEIQILDNTASIYANLKEWQYHGSVYGIMAAKRGHLKPLGEWNTEEVIVNNGHVKVTLNGTVILEGDINEAAKNGTLDGKDHPGLKRQKGHIGFLGHGSELEFRNIRIKKI